MLRNLDFGPRILRHPSAEGCGGTAIASTKTKARGGESAPKQVTLTKSTKQLGAYLAKVIGDTVADIPPAKLKELGQNLDVFLKDLIKTTAVALNASPESLFAQDNERQNTFHRAALNPKELAKLLFQSEQLVTAGVITADTLHGHLQARNKDGLTPLDLAIKQGGIDTAKMLLEQVPQKHHITDTIRTLDSKRPLGDALDARQGILKSLKESAHKGFDLKYKLAEWDEFYRGQRYDSSFEQSTDAHKKQFADLYFDTPAWHDVSPNKARELFKEFLDKCSDIGRM